MKKQTDKKEEKRDKQYWRSIDQLTETDTDREAVRPEFAVGADQPPDNAWSRRSFISTIAASMALAGLSGCRRPVEKIVPYVSRPEDIDPGTPLTYATTWAVGGEAVGILVRSNDGRPTHIEGNPLHPSSGGAVTPQIQASILDLYDPDRSRTVLHKGKESSWDDFLAFWQERHTEFSTNGGAGLAVLCEPFASPTKYRLMEEFKKKFPKAEWLTYDPGSSDQLFGKQGRPLYSYDKARVILSLDSDFLSTESGSINASTGFAKGRKVESKTDSMNRLYVVESAMSVTGSMADHRMRVKSSSIGQFVVDLTDELLGQGLSHPLLDRSTLETSDNHDKKWLSAVASDLISNTGRSVIVAGGNHLRNLYGLVRILNEALGNLGKTVNYVSMKDTTIGDRSYARIPSKTGRGDSLTTLVIIGGNPVYNHSNRIKGFLPKIEHTIHLSTHLDETSQLTEWHLPMVHYLESWSDARSVDGNPSVVQPMIAPLFNGRSDVEVMSLLTTATETKGYDSVRKTWQKILKPINFEADWRRVLHDGLYVDQPLPTVKSPVKHRTGSLGSSFFRGVSYLHQFADKMELVLTSDKLARGRQSNNGWLQELSDPITKMVWGNAALVSPVTAESLGIESGDIVRIKAGPYGHVIDENSEASIEISVWLSPGQADGSLAIALGYGRKMNGRIADDVGVDAYQLFSAGAGQMILPNVTVTPTGRKQELSTTQKHSRMEGRPIVRENSLADYRKTGEFYPEQTAHPPLVPLWEPHKYDEGNQWGMTVDLNACTGCGACTIACQSENNIPIVGAEQANRGREMHWIRIDRYFAGSLDDPEVVHQPVMCQHCENAPCETVCPVAATVHDKEGLNVMVYNRCIGTRYCSNNCPYKVRRFNFFNFTKDTPEVQKMGKNPEVTIRSRGVMEKCTYCVQRISKAKTIAKAEGRDMKDGDVVVACQSACPSKAINFGNIIDPNSKVAQMKKLDRNYAMLEELHCIPRTTYLAKLRNPNPKLTDRNQAHTPRGNG